MENLSSLLRGEMVEPALTDIYSEYTSIKTVQVPDGTLRLIHHNPPGASGKYSVFFVPGWGTLPEGFSGFFRGLNGKTQFYYFETREKNSSNLADRHPDFSMDTHGKDLAEALEQSGLNSGTPYILTGTCWGSSVIAWSLAKRIINCDNVLLFDPMERLWFPKWILKYAVPALPVHFWNIIKPLGKRIALSGMKEEVQRRRISDFIDAADLQKWKNAAEAVIDFSFRKIAGDIPGKVWVANGVHDKVHNSSLYPELASLIPGGRFMHIPVVEAYREELIAAVSLEFSEAGPSGGIPGKFRPYETGELP